MPRRVWSSLRPSWSATSDAGSAAGACGCESRSSISRKSITAASDPSPLRSSSRSVTAAQRELAEEAGLAAGTWHVLVDTLTSPGMSDEAIRIFLARDVREVERDVQAHEEAEMTSEWVDLDLAVRRVLAGEIENAMCAVGVLAADPAALSVSCSDADRAATGVAQLSRAGVGIAEFSLGQPSLDEVFLALTGHSADSPADEAEPTLEEQSS